MKLANQNNTATTASYSIIADTDELNHFKKITANHLKDSVNVPGFRKAKAPDEMVLKNADPDKAQQEFINHAVNDLYIKSQKDLGLKTIGEPKIAITKFVPFTALELSVEVPIITNLKLANYKNLNIPKINVEVTKDELDRNLLELQRRASTLKLVKRVAKKGDQVNIDFEGLDFKTKDKLPQATADEYKLILGDNTLIPGFEDNLVGLKAKETKEFNLIFPKDYPDKSFASKKVTFKTKINEINEVELPKLDDNFASKVGPFKTLNDLKEELKKQLKAELEKQAIMNQENSILSEIAQKSEIELAEQIVEDEASAMLETRKREVLSRGQTWEEFLASRDQAEEEYLKENKEAAVTRVKGGIAIGEIASLENINITDSDIDSHIENLKRQYFDPEMQAQLDNPANRRELAMRILTEKVLDAIRSYQQ